MKPEKQFQHDSQLSRHPAQPEVQSGGKVTSQLNLELSAISSVFTELQKQSQTELDTKQFKERLDHRLDVLDITRTSSVRSYLDAQFAAGPGWAARTIAWIILLAVLLAATLYAWQWGMDAEPTRAMGMLLSSVTNST